VRALLARSEQDRNDALAIWVPYRIFDKSAKTGNVRWFFSSVKLTSALVQDRPLQKTWFPQFLAPQGVIRTWNNRSPCQAREAIPQPAGLAELVFGDQGKSSVRAVSRDSSVKPA